MSTFSNTKPSPILLASFITFFFLLLLSKVKSSNDLSFQFDKFKPDDGKALTFQGYASVLETGALRLNKVGKGLPLEIAGIARYVAPIQIWNKITGEVGSFVTTFSFVMETSVDPKDASDGLTFFLAPPNSPLRRAGGFFGLFNDAKCDSSYQTVAVEFDTIGDQAPNPWDPGYPHIGVDVNCVKSIKTEKWHKRYKGEVANVLISYQASTKTLTASLTYPSDQTSIIVSASVDLKAILPEWVSVGFTGSTVEGREATHEILNWKFASTLDANNNLALENMLDTA